ncbi:MAG TPA: ABC transporter ATP-binding protein, partial [Bauldia sp.]|nr:ABC transporter ATP-binding protein [Bauldia sp.]
MSPAGPLLAFEEVGVSYRHAGGWLPAGHSVSLTVAPGETVRLAGESTLVYPALGYRPDNARLDGGRVLFRGEDVLALGERALRALRGNRISLVPQNPTTALSPGVRVGTQIA